MPFQRSIASILVSLVFAGSAAAANPITITFESFPGADGILGNADDVAAPNDLLTSLRDQFAPIGLTFSQGSLLHGPFFDGNPGNHFISSSNPVGTFSTPVFGLSIQSYSIWNATLTAYDAGGNVIASNYLANPHVGTFLAGTLSVTTTQPIASFSILPPNGNQILNLDNMVLTTSPVPEPSQYALLAGGLLLLGRRFRGRASR